MMALMLGSVDLVLLPHRHRTRPLRAVAAAQASRAEPLFTPESTLVARESPGCEPAKSDSIPRIR